MNITLRKANALQNSIQETIKSIEIRPTVEVTEFKDPDLTIVEANEKLFANDGRRQRLLLALYNIRGLVASANDQAGINLGLTKAAFLDKRVSQLEEIAAAKEQTEISIIKGKIEKIKSLKDEARSRIYGYADSVSTSVLTADQLNGIKAEIQKLKKEKLKINDEVLEANIKTEIPLSDDVVATLQAEGLL